MDFYLSIIDFQQALGALFMLVLRVFLWIIPTLQGSHCSQLLNSLM